MFFQQIVGWFRTLSPEVLTKALVVAVTIVAGLFLVRIIAAFTQRSIMKKSTPQRRMIARKAITYSGFVVVLMAVLSELGVKLTALLGAAGIVGIAVGFASQTSVSNIISGLFLISEKPFSVGDAIRLGTTSGIIMSIDLLSIKIRTFDNLFIRIPNQLILNSEVVNITRFPIRRMDLVLQVGYRQDLAHVREVLSEIAQKNPYSLDEPAPVIMFTEFKESGVEVLFGLWFSKSDFADLKNSIIMEIVSRFAAEGIEIPYPHRTLTSSSAADSLEVRLQTGKPGPAGGGVPGRRG
jgi:small-conductance mechanosensitive channel